MPSCSIHLGRVPLCFFLGKGVKAGDGSLSLLLTIEFPMRSIAFFFF